MKQAPEKITKKKHSVIEYCYINSVCNFLNGQEKLLYKLGNNDTLVPVQKIDLVTQDSQSSVPVNAELESTPDAEAEKLPKFPGS